MTPTRTAKLSPSVGPSIGSQIQTAPGKFETVMDEYDDGTYVTFNFSLTDFDDSVTYKHGDDITWRDRIPATIND